MRPLSQLSLQQRKQIVCLFADIDDTITTDGKLTADAYAAMERWQNAGKLMIPITGRPAGWCDHIARMWPIDAVVGENGAFYFQHDTQNARFIREFVVDEPTRQKNRQKMLVIRQRILTEVSGCDVASDQNYREADLAIDFCEDVAPLGDEAVSHIVRIMEEEGMSAKVSSIHVNGWFGDYDKLSMTKRLLKERFSVDLEQDKRAYAFVGDSPNDAPMFGFFPLSIGVRNIENFIGQLGHEPAFMTEKPGGAGFAELIETLLS